MDRNKNTLGLFSLLGWMSSFNCFTNINNKDVGFDDDQDDE